MGGISQRLQLTEVGKRDESRTSFVSELGTAVEGRWYLGWSAFGSNRFVNIFFLNRRFTTESTEQGTISDRFGIRRFRKTYASCSTIQASRRDASCSRRLTVSSRRLISRSRSAILSSRSSMSSNRTLLSFHHPGGVSSLS
jgi:hypothetical protein